MHEVSQAFRDLIVKFTYYLFQYSSIVLFLNWAIGRPFIWWIVCIDVFVGVLSYIAILFVGGSEFEDLRRRGLFDNIFKGARKQIAKIDSCRSSRELDDVLKKEEGNRKRKEKAKGKKRRSNVDKEEGIELNNFNSMGDGW